MPPHTCLGNSPNELTALQPCHPLFYQKCRACEEVLYGRDSVSLSTSKEVSRAGELARWIVMDSGVSATLAAGSAAFAKDFMPCVLGLTAGSSGNHRVTNQSEATLCRSAA